MRWDWKEPSAVLKWKQEIGVHKLFGDHSAPGPQKSEEKENLICCGPSSPAKQLKQNQWYSAMNPISIDFETGIRPRSWYV